MAERPPRWFENVAIQQGLKMGIGGILAFYIALWQGLHSPGWCIFTVVVLTLAQYVGAIAEKSVLRMIGTIIGALLGIWLIGDHGSDPVFVMTGCFIIAMVGTTMFGGNRYPYAFFLSALTTLVVVNNTMTNPSEAWHVGVARAEEIGVGILSSMVVTGIFWPRYARLEYRKNFRSALRDVGRVATERVRLLLDVDTAPEHEAEIRKIEASFAVRMNALRLLIRYGQRESQYFKARLPIRMKMIGELGACFEAAVSFGQRLPKQSRYRELVSDELRKIHELLKVEFEQLTNWETSPQTNPELRKTVDACTQRLNDLRDRGATKDIPIQEAMDFAAHYTALLDLVDRLGIIRDCLNQLINLPEVIAPHITTKPERFKLDPFWIHNGIKGGITATLALLYVNWINPPGGGALPFAAWLFTAMSRTYPGGEGDRRSFTYVIRASVYAIPYTVLLFFLTPFLADYFVMNAFLFIGLFMLGYTISSQGGISLYAQCGMLLFVGTIAMNPQEPVGPQAIIGNYFGVVLAVLLSSVIQRLLWPVLPQREICKLFAEYFSICRRFLGPLNEPEFERLQDRLALIPSEAGAWIKVTNTPEYPKGETERLAELLHTAQHLGYSILSARKLAGIEIPPEIRTDLTTNLQAIERGSEETLQALEDAFAEGRTRKIPGSQMSVFQAIEGPLSKLRQEYLSGALRFPQALQYLGAMDFLESTSRNLDRCSQQLAGLKLEAYSGDYAL